MQKQTMKEKLAEAVTKYGMRILGEGKMTKTGHRFFLVTSREYAKSNRCYIVEQHPGHLTCNCVATKPCVHITLVAQHLNAEQQAEAERLVELPRELANVETSEETKLETVIAARQPSIEQIKDALAHIAYSEGDDYARFKRILDAVHKCHDCGQPEQAYRCHSCQNTYECERQYQQEMRAEAERQQAEPMSVRAERAILDNRSKPFSIFASE